MPPELGPSRFLRGVLHLLDDLVVPSEATGHYRLTGVRQADALMLTFVKDDEGFDIWLRPRDDATEAFSNLSRLSVGYQGASPPPDAMRLLHSVCSRIAVREPSLAESWISAIRIPQDSVEATPRAVRAGNETSISSWRDGPVAMPATPIPRLQVPVSSVADVDSLVRAGADEFFCGMQVNDLRDRAWCWSGENGRANPRASIPGSSLPGLVERVHETGRRLRLVMNRQYGDEAIPSIRDAVAAAVDAGIDGLILADLHLAAFVRGRWPHLHLTGSAIMGMSNPGALGFARATGLNRVVLPRAMRLPEIVQMAQGTGPELEIFVARERCRFANAFCHAEHLVPTPGEPDGTPWKDRAICHQQMTGKHGTFRLDDPADTMEACGLCALAYLRNLPRIRAFKIVGRGWCADQLLPFVETARRILDGDLRTSDAVRALVQEDGRLHCTPASCYFPEALPRLPRTAVAVLPERSSPKVLRPRWAPAEADLFWSPGPDALPTELPSGVQGLVIGHETCAHLLPSVVRVHRWAPTAPGGRICLALPPLYGPAQLRRGLALAEALTGAARVPVEISANDLGTLHELRSRLGPGVELVLGRSLVWMHNDPRLARVGADAEIDALVTALPMGHLEIIARTFGIRRASVSVPGTWSEWSSDVLDRLVVHAGPALLSSGRACHFLAGQVGRIVGGRPFSVPERCPRPCRGASVEEACLESPETESFFAVENALYAMTEGRGVPPAAVDRVVVHGVA